MGPRSDFSKPCQGAAEKSANATRKALPHSAASNQPSGLLLSPRLRSNESPSALDVTMAQRSELDYLIYNDPLGYADLILNGDPEEYLKNMAGSHGLEI